MCTPQFMQQFQAGLAQLSGGQQSQQGQPGMMPSPGAATGGANTLPPTAGIPSQLPTGAPPLPTAPQPAGGMATGQAGTPLPQPGGGMPQPAAGAAPPGGGAPGMARPPMPTPTGGPLRLGTPLPVAGPQQPGLNPNTPPGAGVRGYGVAPQPMGALPMRPNALPRRSLRR